MSTGTNAFGPRAGFNQSGGAYFMCVQPLETSVSTIGLYINQITTAPTGSGGAPAPPSLTLVSMSSIVGAATNGASSFVQPGKLLKDMGRTVVSAGRVFRKFAPVVSNANTVSSLGVVGAAGTATSAGYGSFYLEVGREGAGPATPAPIARYF